MSESLLQLRVSAGYPSQPDVLREVSLEIQSGEILGLAGGSGGGKSTIILAILGLLKLRGGWCRGEMLFRGTDLLRLDERRMRGIRGREIGFVPQSPLTSLNPNLRLGAQLDEAWRAHQKNTRDWRPLLESVSLPPDLEFLRLFPRNLSVGMAQRFLIAMAIMHDPVLLIADEPTSALDMLTQSEVLTLFRRLNRERGIAMLYVSHDLASVAALCDRVAVLHRGEVAECGLVDEVFRSPRHDYTRRLIAAIPGRFGARTQWHDDLTSLDRAHQEHQFPVPTHTVDQ